MENGLRTRIIFIRHGEAENNRLHIIGADMNLTEKGIKEVVKMEKRLKTVYFDAIYSSDLHRTVHTAKIFAQTRKLGIIIKKELRERFYGRFEGKKISEYQHDMKHIITQMKTLTDAELFTFRRYDGFETDKEVILRCRKFMRQVTESFTGKTVLAVTHGLFMRIVLINAGFATYAELPPFSIKNTSSITVTTNGDMYTIQNTYGIRKHIHHSSV